MATKLQIVNKALGRIGAARLVDLTTDVEELRVVNDCYDMALDELLEEHRWTFAQSRVVLTASATTLAHDEDGMDYVYYKPTDFLKLHFTNSATAVTKIETDGILSNESALGIIFTKRITDTTKFPGKFTSALVSLLAYEFCFSLVQASAKAQALFEEYEKVKLPRAIESDSAQGSPDEAAQDEWEIAMTKGVCALDGKTSDPTWVPVE